MDATDLGACLRTWRERVDPGDVGIARTSRRRVVGLRRQEVATLAGLSVEYLARLEQGRASRPSAEVLGPLARALRLSTAERDHLFLLAGHAAPSPGSAGRHVSAHLHRIVDRLQGTAVTVIDVEWNVVLANPLAIALLGEEETAPGPGGNVLRRHFAGVRSRVLHETPEEDAAFEAGAVADLRAAVGRYPEDEGLRTLIADLHGSSDRFRALWESGAVANEDWEQKTVRHPEVGDVRIDCDVLADTRSALRLVVYDAAPGTKDRGALDLLAAIGTQDLAS